MHEVHCTDVTPVKLRYAQYSCTKVPFMTWTRASEFDFPLLAAVNEDNNLLKQNTCFHTIEKLGQLKKYNLSLFYEDGRGH